MQALFEAVVEKKVAVADDFAASVVAFCAQTSNLQIAEKLCIRMKPRQVPALSAFIRFYAGSGRYDRACDVCEHDLLRLHDPATGSHHLDARMECSSHVHMDSLPPLVASQLMLEAL